MIHCMIVIVCYSIFMGWSLVGVGVFDFKVTEIQSMSFPPQGHGHLKATSYQLINMS